VAVVVADAAPPTLLQLRQFCSVRLPPHKIPRALVIAAAIPLDARGKTDHRQLEALVRDAVVRRP
jgi:acyl-CoA synthetase (AMP-forming)/AMP-acid ligase II